MRDWEQDSFVDFIKGDEETLSMFGPYIQDKKERTKLEESLEEISEKVISRIDESMVADFDYSDESLEAIENIIDNGFNGTKEDIDPDLFEDLVMDLGSYVGLTIIHNLGGEWRFRSDFIHSSIYFYTIESECFPFHRVIRRLLNGRTEALHDFYQSLIEVFGVAD
jgi:hypothetical protein